MSIISGVDELMRELDELGPKANVAMADALNHTANQARLALRQAMTESFDRPTPFTLNAIRVINAKSKDPEAAVFVKDEKSKDTRAGRTLSPEDWFRPQVFGGERPLKNSELWLRKAGILPNDKYIVPATGAKLDRFGNISRGMMNKILSGLMAAENHAGYAANASASARSKAKGNADAFFVMRSGNTPIGIGERRGKSVQMVLAFVRKPNYAPRLDFFGVVNDVVDQNLENNLDLAITKALQV